MENSDIEIGKSLREAREATGYTIADVVYRAHLPRSVIEALEAEDFSVFASPTYAKSFLNQYSEFLNVDAHPWLDALEPSSFVQTEGLHSIFETAPVSHRSELPRARKEQRSSTLSYVMLFAFTLCLAYAAVKGFQYAEKEFGGLEKEEAEDKGIRPKADIFQQNSTVQKTTEQIPLGPVTNPPSTPVGPIIVKKQVILPSPPPRAIIVPD